MKIFILSLIILLNVKYLYGEVNGDLLWDYERHKVDRKINNAMDYVKDINERIEISLGKGNVERAYHLSYLLHVLISTGGPFGLSDRAATQQELRTINISAILIIKAKFDLNNRFLQSSSEDEKKERIAYEMNNYPFSWGEYNNFDTKVKQQIDLFTSLIETHWQSSKIGQGYPIVSTIKEDVKSLITPPDKTYAEKVFAQKFILEKLDWYRKDQKGNIIINDFINEQEFYLQNTAIGSCFFAAAEKDNSYRSVDFAEDLKSLNAEKRRWVVEFMQRFYQSELSNESRLTQDQKKEFAKLFREAKFNFSLDKEMSKESIDFLNKPENFSRLISFHLNTGICWLRDPSQEIYSYSSLYAHIKKKNIFTLKFDTLKGKMSFSRFIVDKSFETSFMLFNYGDIHFSGLIPLEQKEKFKLTPLANEEYLKRWHPGTVASIKWE